MANPMARKSTNTADRMVKKECHKLLLNLWAEASILAHPMLQWEMFKGMESTHATQ